MADMAEIQEYLLSREEFYSALAKRHGEKMQKLLENSEIAVFGLGGLGSHIVNILARSGVGKIYAVDFDTVDISNLHRQLYRISQIGMKKTSAIKEIVREANPFCRLISFDMKFSAEDEDSLNRTAEIISQSDIVCEAFDNAESKAELVNFCLERFPEKAVVCASGMAGEGSANLIETKRKMKNLYLCGDETSEVNENQGMFCSRVSVCASHQAHMIIRLISGETQP